MILGVLLILFAWFIQMPFWLSVLTTVLGGLRIVGKLAVYIVKLCNAASSD